MPSRPPGYIWFDTQKCPPQGARSLVLFGGLAYFPTFSASLPVNRMYAAALPDGIMDDSFDMAATGMSPLQWTRVNPTTSSPSSRFLMAMAVGATDDQLYMTTGAQSANSYFADLWHFSGTTLAWTKLASSENGVRSSAAATVWLCNLSARTHTH